MAAPASASAVMQPESAANPNPDSGDMAGGLHRRSGTNCHAGLLTAVVSATPDVAAEVPLPAARWRWARG